ncbi:MAG: hypothetical protein WC224_04005 [Sphaerochaetaceae bacterium]
MEERKERKREFYPTAVFTKEVIESVLQSDPSMDLELLNNISLRKRPQKTLEANLENYSKKYLLELADDLGLTISTSKLKKEVVELVSQQIEGEYTRLLPYLPVKNLEFLVNFREKSSLKLNAQQLRFSDISHLQNLGFLFLYKNGRFFNVVSPEEVSEKLEILDVPRFWREAELNQRLDAYAIALTNLYGVLDIDQFAIVWNRFERESLTPAMTQDELQMLSRVQYYWWIDDEQIISSYFKSYEEVELFLENVKQVSYYSPSREDLIKYFKTPYDDQSPAVSAMMEFLSGYRLPAGEQIEDLMDEISDACIVGEQMQDVFNLLNEYGLLFNEMEEINRFTELYTQMNENCRKWELRGHFPRGLKKS